MKPSNEDTKIFGNGMRVTKGHFEEETDGSVHKAFMSWQLQLPMAIFFGLAALFSWNNDWLILASITTVLCFLFFIMFVLFHGVLLLVYSLKSFWKWLIGLVKS